MEIKRKYIIKCSINGDEIDETDNLTEAKRLIQQYLIDDYNEFLQEQEKKGGKFITYWEWYYSEGEEGVNNGDFYEYEVI